jgi:hypothetical protein
MSVSDGELIRLFGSITVWLLRSRGQKAEGSRQKTPGVQVHQSLRFFSALCLLPSTFYLLVILHDGGGDGVLAAVRDT